MKVWVLAIIFLAGGISTLWAADDTVAEQTDATDTSAMTEEEVEAELRRIEETLSDTDELKEFVPSKPLAADMPIALPSDL